MTQRILYVTGSLDVGGAQRDLVQLARRLDRALWQPAIYCLTRKGALAPELERVGIPVSEPWIARRVPVQPGRLPMRAMRLAVAAFSLLVELLRHRPAIVHFFLPEAYIVGGFCALIARCRVLVMSRRSLNLYQQRRPALRRFERWLHPHMAAVLGNSGAIIDELRAEGVPAKRLHLIHNGVDLAPFAALPPRAEIRASLDLPSNTFVMVMVANLIPYKGHADLLAALAQIDQQLPQNWRLLCVGRDEGPGEALRAQATRLGLGHRIAWLGLRADVPNLLAAADLGLLCSHEEGFSNAILEGMAARLPMVVTDVGGNGEAVLDGVTGLIVPPRDPARLGQAILTLARDPARAAAMGKAGRARVEENFSVAACVRRYETLYGALLRPSSHPLREVA